MEIKVIFSLSIIFGCICNDSFLVEFFNLLENLEKNVKTNSTKTEKDLYTRLILQDHGQN